jgi:hypothetical protein
MNALRDLISEASTMADLLFKPTGTSPEDNPPKERLERIEIITFAAEDAATGHRLVALRQIYRPSPEAPGRLLPLIFPKAPSRFVIASEKSAGAASMIRTVHTPNPQGFPFQGARRLPVAAAGLRGAGSDPPASMTSSWPSAIPKANRSVRVFDPGVDASYRYVAVKAKGRPTTIRFCWTVNRNAAGRFLIFRETVTAKGSRRDRFEPILDKRAAIAACKLYKAELIADRAKAADKDRRAVIARAAVAHVAPFSTRFSTIERTIVDYFDANGSETVERDGEWLLELGDCEISLSGLTAAILTAKDLAS